MESDFPRITIERMREVMAERDAFATVALNANFRKHGGARGWCSCCGEVKTCADWLPPYQVCPSCFNEALPEDRRSYATSVPDQPPAVLIAMGNAEYESWVATSGVAPCAAPSITVPLKLLVDAKKALSTAEGSFARGVWCDLRDAIAGVTAGAPDQTVYSGSVLDELAHRNAGVAPCAAPSLSDEQIEQLANAAGVIYPGRVSRLQAINFARAVLATDGVPVVVANEQTHPVNRLLFKDMCRFFGIVLGKDSIVEARAKIDTYGVAPYAAPGRKSVLDRCATCDDTGTVNLGVGQQPCPMCKPDADGVDLPVGGQQS